MKWVAAGQRRELPGPSRSFHQYVATYTYVSGGERPVSYFQKSAGTIWRGVRGQRHVRSLFVQIRDNHVYVVYVGVGGSGRDTVAALCAWGAVVAITVHIQCGQHSDRSIHRRAEEAGQLP